jgi:hypothetical protein
MKCANVACACDGSCGRGVPSIRGGEPLSRFTFQSFCEEYNVNPQEREALKAVLAAIRVATVMKL